jgi:hypothetical protein
VQSDSRVRLNPQAVFRELADGTGVVLHLGSTGYHGLNRVGVLIWRLLEHEPTVDQVVAGMRAQLEDAPPELEEDVREFLNSLQERDLIQAEAPNSAGDG